MGPRALVGVAPAPDSPVWTPPPGQSARPVQLPPVLLPSLELLPRLSALEPVFPAGFLLAPVPVLVRLVP